MIHVKNTYLHFFPFAKYTLPHISQAFLMIYHSTQPVTNSNYSRLFSKSLPRIYKKKIGNIPIFFQCRLVQNDLAWRQHNSVFPTTSYGVPAPPPPPFTISSKLRVQERFGASFPFFISFFWHPHTWQTIFSLHFYHG